MSITRLAVTGITGHTGSHLLAALVRDGFSGELVCLVRESSDTAALSGMPFQTTLVRGDVNKEESLLALTRGADTVIHLYNIRHSAAMLAACLANGVSRAVLVHTSGIYSKYKEAAASYIAAEREVFSLSEREKAPQTTILRPTMIFGDLRDRNISKFIRMADRLPLMPEINHGAGRVNPVNARDLALACLAAAKRERLPDKAYDISGEGSVTLHQLFCLIGEGLHKNIRTVSCPMGLAYAGARALFVLSRGKHDLTEKVLRMGEHRDYGHEAASRDFGFSPEPLRDGIFRETEEYLRWKKKKGA